MNKNVVIKSNQSHTGSVLSTGTAAAIDAMETMWKQVGSIRTQVRGECLTERPEGYFTIDEYCREFGIGLSTAQHQIRQMMRLKSLRKERVYLPDALGRVVIQNIYMPIPMPILTELEQTQAEEGCENA